MKTHLNSSTLVTRNMVVKYCFSLLFLLFSAPASAQPTFVGTMLPDGNYQTYNLNDLGAFRQVRLQATSSAAADARIWEFATGNYFENWRPYTFPTTTSYDQVIDPSINTASARYNDNFGGASSFLPPVVSGNYYTLNITELAAPADQFMAILETSFSPVTIDALSADPSSGVTDNSPVDVEITTSSAPSVGEQIFLRYSTDNYVTSSLVEFAFLGSTGTAQIPGLPEGTTVHYYVYSSNSSAANALASAATTGQVAHDMLTLNLKDDSGNPYTYIVDAALPVELVSFEAQTRSKDIKLNWETVSELNNSHFELERSKDASNWVNIARVEALGNSSGQGTYDFIDEYPVNGANYYRLKQIDFDGLHSYSQIVLTNWRGGDGVDVYPNPVRDRIFFSSQNFDIGASEISIFDQNGRRVLTGKLSDNSIDVSHLGKGVYVVQYVLNGGVFKKQIFIQ